MSLEIERKFLVTSKDYRSESKKIDIEQAYFVADENISIRIRIEGLIGSITIKTSKTERTNHEFEYTIPIDEARYLINKTKYKIIKKTRYLCNYKGKIWEIDEFKGKHLGLVIAEIELNEENESFELPSWIGREVTSDPKYRNSNLAKKE
tara:strand:+ start:1592 stop:2041 length:450 start_codon:yes stop_codon:yes gene_type:complete